MKFIKLSSVFLLTLFAICLFTPEEANARHHCRSRSSFGLSFNFAPTPSYVVAPAPAPVPVAVMPSYAAPVYPYPYYYSSAPVVVQRPAYIQPGFSYSYWRY